MTLNDFERLFVKPAPCIADELFTLCSWALSLTLDVCVNKSNEVAGSIHHLSPTAARMDEDINRDLATEICYTQMRDFLVIWRDILTAGHTYSRRNNWQPTWDVLKVTADWHELMASSEQHIMQPSTELAETTKWRSDAACRPDIATYPLFFYSYRLDTTRSAISMFPLFPFQLIDRLIDLTHFRSCWPHKSHSPCRLTSYNNSLITEVNPWPADSVRNTLISIFIQNYNDHKS